MKAFQRFNITQANFDEQTYVATFTYNFDHDVFFTEKIDFSDAKVPHILPNSNDIDGILFHMSIAIGISYYKLYPTKTIHVHSGRVDEKQREFWKQFYLQGLGEFFYTNNLDPTGLATFVSESDIDFSLVELTGVNKRLVPIGGGKDSCVTIEHLLHQGKDITLYTNGKDYEIHNHIQEVSGLPRIITPRTIDPLLISMSKEGWYNGHVPITGIISFISIFVGYLSGHDHIAFSNERSANFGNTVWKGLDINHQWSKSIAFEKAFRSYVQTYIHTSISYTSYLRKWFEFAIAKDFSSMKKYLPVFSSCNRNFHLAGSRTDRRCGICPKCLFTYAMMRPFLSSKEVIDIRGEELYQQKKLLNLFQELRGVSGIKPFECVGTYEESQYATRLFIQHKEYSSPILTYFEEYISTTKTASQREQLGIQLSKTYED